MKTEKLGWAIVGTGIVARRFAADMRFSATGRIAAIASRSAARAADLAAAVGPGVAAGSLDEILARPDVDAVYVATPNEMHAEHALAVISAGKPVLVEKPFALATQDAEHVAEAARARGVFAMEAMWMRFTPGIVRLKKLVEDGAIGEIVSLGADLSFAAPGDPANRLLDPASGGGALNDLGIYLVSLALHLLGEPTDVAAVSLGGPSGVDRRTALTLSYPGAVAQLGCGLDAEGRNEATVVGTGGVAATQGSFLCPPVISLRRTQAPPSASREEAAALPNVGRGRLPAVKAALRPLRTKRFATLFEGSGLQYQVDHVAACLAEKRIESPVMPMRETIAALRIVEAARAAAAQAERRGSGEKVERSL